VSQARPPARLRDVKRIIVLLAAAWAAAGQAPRVGDVNLYGLHKVSPQQILDAAGVKTGAPLPPSKGDLQERIQDLPEVLLARVEAVCCEGANAVVFIGIQESGAPYPIFRSDPAGNATLPQETVDAYNEFASAAQRADARGGPAGPNPAKLVSFAAEHAALLREVVRNASEPDQRAAAAALIGYAPASQEFADDLHYALDDPDPQVRANAIRSLKAFGRAGRGIEIPAEWFVDLLHSVVLSDRTQAVDTLLAVTEDRKPSAIALLRERALSELADMARWKTLRYAMPPFLLLARTAGVADEDAREAWGAGRRDAVIEKALAGR
jgi:hypothetical protein